MAYNSIKTFDLFIKENNIFDEYEVIDIEKLEQLKTLSGNNWLFFSDGGEKFFNSLLNTTTNNIFVVIDKYELKPLYLIFWDRMIVIDNSNSIFMFQDYDMFMKEEIEIKNKIEDIIKRGNRGIAYNKNTKEIKKQEFQNKENKELKVIPYNYAKHGGFIGKKIRPADFGIKIRKNTY